MSTFLPLTLLCTIICAISIRQVDAYVVISSTCRPMGLNMVVDPIMLGANTVLDMDIALEVGVAVVSAAAGALSQVPRIQQLERELTSVKASLTSSESELVEKIRVLEDKLFVMDQEFEEQTVRFQRQYDRTQKQKMEEMKEKLKSEMAFKLEIQLAQERSSKLMEKADKESGRTSRQEELSQLKLKQIRLDDLNIKLEQALKDSDEELRRLRSESSRKKKFFLW
jgi:hypothetical protein